MERVKEILRQQLELLAEESKRLQPNDKGYKPCLVEYSEAICQTADCYKRLLDTEKPKREC